jgi:aryl-alcohol dehydrogenase-like predicted oxidoreductase
MDLLDKAETLRFLHADGQRTVAQMALQFIIAQPRIASVLPTVTELDQLDEFAAAATLPPLSADELERIAELYAENFGVARREYAKR